MSDKMIWSIVEILNVLVEIGIISLFINRLLKKNSNNKLIYYSAYLVSFIILSLASLFTPKAEILVSTTMLIILLIMLLFYEGQLYYKAFFVILFIVFMVASEVLVMAILTLLYGTIPDEFMNPGFGRLLGMIMTKLMLFWIVIIVNKFLKKKVETVPFRYWLSICIIPFISIFMLSIVNSVMTLNNKSNYNVITLILLGVFYINYMLFDFIDSYSKQIKLKVMEELFEREKQNYEVLEITEKELKLLKHDIKNHVLSIEALLKEGEIATATEHISSLKRIANELGSVVYTGNIAIDAILNTKGIIANASNLKYMVSATLLSQISIKPVDICIIFSNAIDNAIESCNRMKNDEIEKFIFISIQIKDKYLVISIQNSAENVNVISNNVFKSSKQDGQSHGFGFESIKQTVAKYDGLISTKFEDSTFNLNIIL